MKVFNTILRNLIYSLLGSLLVGLVTFALLLIFTSGCSAQSAPEYVGPMDNTVNVPAVRFGKQYTLKGSRFGSGMDTALVDSLIGLSTWQSVMTQGNVSDRCALISGNDDLGTNTPGLRLEYDAAMSRGVVSQWNGLAGVGAFMTLGNNFWAIEQQSGSMSFGTEVSGYYRFYCTNPLAGMPATQDDELVRLDQLRDSLQARTDTATVTVSGGIGVAVADIATDSYGIVRWTNTTGAPAGSGVHIKVTYSSAYNQFAVPVVSPLITDTEVISITVANLSLPSFDIEIGQDIPDGESIGFTYMVKGK